VRCSGTLSPASIECSRTPAVAKKGLAHYDAPVFRLGRLAVDRTVQARGLGGALLLRAADRCIRVAQDVDGVALLIDAKNDRAARWYESYGALRIDDAPLSLVLPLAVAADALKRGIQKGNLTGQALIAAMQASPHRDIDIESKRAPMPVREVDL